MIKSALLAALIAVESAGNPDAVGDNGKALGILQIHACVIHDVNRVAGTNYTHKDAFDPKKAMEIYHVYIGHYATPDRLKRQVTDEDRARIWNGGPNGWRKPCTVKYWQRVKRHHK